jgi:large conductance mechanosensitive channel
LGFRNPACVNTEGGLAVLKGFRDFVLRGNVVELATAVIIGAAFNSIVEAFTKRVLEPLINSIPGGDPAKAAEGVGFCVGECRYANPNNANPMDALNYIDLGAVITAAINFLIVAFVVYFIIVLPYNKLSSLVIGDKEAEATEVALLTEIRNLMDPEATARAEAEAAEKADSEARTAHLEYAPSPPAIAPLAGGEPLIRPSTSNPASGAIPRWEQGGYPTGTQRPVAGGGYPTGSVPPVAGGGYPTGSVPPVAGGDYPGAPTPPPARGYAPGGDYQPPPFPGEGPEFPGEHPSRHSR